MFAMKSNSSTFANNILNFEERTDYNGSGIVISNNYNAVPGITNVYEIWTEYLDQLNVSERVDLMEHGRLFFLQGSFYFITFSYILGSTVTLAVRKITSTGVTGPVTHSFAWPVSAAVGSYLSLGSSADCNFLCVYVDRSSTANRCIALIRSVVSGSYDSRTYHVWGCELTLDVSQTNSTSTIPGTTLINFVGIQTANLPWTHVPGGDGVVMIGQPWYTGPNPYPYRWYWCRIRNGSVVVDSMVKGSYSTNSVNSIASDRGSIIGDKNNTLFTLGNSVFLFEADVDQLSSSRLYKIDFSNETAPVMTRVRNAFAPDTNLHATSKNFNGIIAHGNYLYVTTIADPENDGTFGTINRRFRLNRLYPSNSTDNDGKCDYSDGFPSSEISNISSILGCYMPAKL